MARGIAHSGLLSNDDTKKNPGRSSDLCPSVFCFLRCNVNFFCLCLICDFSYYNPVLTAEMSHFHDQKVADFKIMMQHFIQEQIDYHQRVSLTKFA